MLARYASTNTITPASVASNVIASDITLGNYVSPGSPCGSGLSNRVVTVGTAGTISFTLTPAPGYKLDLSYNKAAVRATSTGNVNAPTFTYTISSGGGTGSGTGTSPTTASCLGSAGTNTQGDWNYADFTVNPGYSVVFSYGFTGASSTAGNTQVHTLEVYGTVTCAATISNNLVGSAQTVTVNTTPTALTGNLPTVSGTGSYSYQWQSSTDNSTFSNISGATSQNYQPGVMSSNQYFRRIASYNECAISTSASVSIATTTNPCFLPIGNNIVGSNQTISQGSSPLAFTGSLPVGATQIYSYQWEQSSDNSSWSTLSGGTLQGYSHGILSQNTYFRRIVFSNVCTPHTSSIISVTTLAACVNPLGNNTIGTDQTISINTAPSLFTGSIPTGGQNGYVYQWEQSINQSTWSPISGATAQNYQAGNILQQTWFRRIVSDLPCVAVTSSPVSVGVVCNIPIGNNQIGNAQTIVIGNSASAFTGSVPTGGSGIYTHQWESSGDNSNWVSISGATSATFAPGTPNQTLWYRRIVSGTLCSSVISNVLEIAVVCGNPIGNNTIGAAQTIVSGDTPAGLTGTVATGGPGGFSYQWMQSTNQINWSNISGATTQNYQPVTLTQTTWFRRLAIAVSPCVPDSGNITAVTVLPDNSVVLARYCVTQNLLSPSYVLPGGLLMAGNISLGGSFTINTGGPCAQGLSLTNSTTANGTVAFALTPATGYQIRLSEVVCGGRRSTNGGANVVVSYSISSGGGSASSSSLSVPAVGCITSQNNAFNWNFPNVIVPNGRTVTFTETFSSFAANGGATQVFSCEVLGTIECESVISGNTIAAAQTINYNNTPALLSGSTPGGGPGSIAYSWQSSSNNSSWSTISGASSRDFQPGALIQNTYYRRIASYSVCAADTTPSLPILVIQNVCVSPLGNNTVSGNQTILTGNAPTLFNGSTPTGGTGVFGFAWEESSDNSNWVSVSGATSAILQYGNVSQNTYFRRIVSASPCTPSTSNVISVLAEPCNTAITGNTLSASQTIASGTTPAMITGNMPSGSPGYFGYTWESSSDNSTWSLISGASLQNYQPGIVYSDSWYRRIVLATPCTHDTSTSISVTVSCGSPIGNNTITGTQTISGGDLPIQLSGTSPSGGSGIYTYQWESSVNQSNWGAITDASTVNYLPVNFTQSVWVRRVIYSAPCTPSNSNEIYISVYPDTSVVLVRYGVTSGQLTPAYTHPGGNFTVSNLSVGGIFALSGSPCSTGLTLTNGSTTVGTGTLTFTLSATSGYVLNLNRILSGIRRSGQGAQNCQISYSISGGGATGSSSILPTASTSCQTISNAQGNWNFNNFTVPEGRTITFTLTFSTFGGTNASTQLHTFELFGNVTCEAVIGASTITADQTILTGTSPALISGNSPSGGPGVLQYQWQQSVNQISWTSIGGATTVSYQPGVLSQSIYYRRASSYSVCASNTSNEVLVTVFTAPGNNIINSAQTVCSSSVSGTLTGSTPTGGNGSFTYQWESSADNSSWTAIVNETAQHFTPSTPLVQTWYRRQATAYFSSFSNSVSITPIPLISQNNLTGTQTICPGNAPALMSGTIPSGGSGTYSYQWQSSTDNLAWIAYTGGTQQNLSSIALSVNTYFRRSVTSGPCSNTSTELAITITDPLGNNQITANQTICIGQTPLALSGTLPTGSGGIYAYQWQSSTDNVTWNTVTNGTTQGLTLGSHSQTSYYRRIVISTPCTANTSTGIEISILPLIGNNTILNNQTICVASIPSTLSGTMPTGGNGVYTYVWLSGTTPDGSWVVISNQTSQFFAPGALMSNTYFRRLVNAGSCQDSSNTISVNTNATIGGNVINTDQTICSGIAPSMFSGTNPSGGNGIYLYQWESSVNNTTWNVINNETAASYTSGSLSNSAYFRRLVSAGPCPLLTSNFVFIQVNPVIGDNIISQNQTICSGQAPTILSGAMPTGGNGSYSYQWQSSTNVITWSSTTGGSSQSFSPGILTQSTYYRRIVSSGVCTPNSSDSVLITVLPLIGNNTIQGAQTICVGVNPNSLSGSLPTGGDSFYSYLWESSSDNSAWTTISSASAQNHSPAMPSSNAYYRRVVSSGYCPAITSGSVSILRYNAIGDNTIGNNQTLCAAGIPQNLTGSAPSGGEGSYSYLWQSSLNNSTWGNHPGTAQNLTTSYLSATTYYRRVVSSSLCPANTSSSATIILLVGQNDIASSQTIPYNSAPATIVGLTNLNMPGYAWEQSHNNFHWVAIPGGNGSVYNPSTLIQHMWYRRKVAGPGCDTITSAPVKITLTMVTDTALTATSNSPVCAGSPVYLNSQGPSNATYLWLGPNGYTSTLQNPSFALATESLSGIYRVRCTKVNGDTASVTVNVEVGSSLGNFQVLYNNPVCAGSTLLLSSSYLPRVEYTWSGPNGFTSLRAVNSIANAQTNLNGIYTVWATSPGCQSITRNISVVVNAPLNPAPGSNGPVCQSNVLSLTANNRSGATYLWAGPNGFTSAVPNPSISNVQTVSSGTYTLTMSGLGCSSVTQTHIVIVNASIGNLSIASNSPACLGNTLILSIPSYINATYNWSGPNGFTSAGSNILSRTNGQTNFSGVYTLETVVPGCGSATRTRSVTVFPSLAAVAGSNSPVCAGNNLTLTTSAVAGAAYSWAGPNGFTSALQNPTIASAQTIRSGNYTLTLSLPGCGSASYVTTVQVNTSVNTAILTGNSPVCEGNSINLTATAINNASYSWSGPSAFTATGNSIARTPSQLAHGGIYTATVVVPGCGTSVMTYKVLVLGSNSVIASVGSGVCAGAPMYLYATSIIGASYAWSGPNGFTSTVQNPSFSNVQPNQSGIYSVIASQGSCGSSSSTVNVLISARPSSATISAAQTICIPGALTLTGTNIAGATLSWAGPGGFTASGSSFTKASTTSGDGGVYTYTVVTSNCGSAIRTVNVSTLSGSVVNGTVYPNPQCAGQPLYLQSDYIIGATYNWSGPAGFNVNAQNTDRTQVTTLMSGTYTLTVNVPGCGLVSQNFPVTINTCREGAFGEDAISEVPAELNAFSIELFPNPTEGLTKVSVKAGNESENYQLQVFDLLGHVVLVPGKVSTLSDRKIWELDFRGIAKGVYFVKVHTENGEKVERIVVR